MFYCVDRNVKVLTLSDHDVHMHACVCHWPDCLSQFPIKFLVVVLLLLLRSLYMLKSTAYYVDRYWGH